MKKTRRIIGLLLTLALLVSMTPMAFVFAGSLGESLYESSIDMGERITLAKGVYWNSSYSEKITENYIEYTPGNSVKPIIAHGNDIYGAASFKAVTNMAAAEGKNVVAGLNGDFFEMSNGVPVGLTIKDGVLLSSESVSKPSLGFFADGSLVIGRPNVVIKAVGENIGDGFSYVNFNKALTPGSGVVLYSRVYGDDYTNKAKIGSYNVLLKVDKEQFGINDYFEGTVVEVKESQGATYIPEGHMVLSISLNTTYANSLSKLMNANHGDLISFTVTGDRAWNQVKYAIGSGDKLVENGKALTAADKEIHPRTAVGIKADGSAVFYTVDGRQTDHSKGLSLAELSQRMIELGCVEAVNMDGGGSTAIHGIYPGETSLSLINQPSQTSLRSCANYILLINTAKAVGKASQLHIYPYDFRVLAGSEIKLQVKASDANYYAVDTPGQLQFSQTGSVGSFNSEGVFAAGKSKATGSISVSSGSNVKGSAKVEVVEKPEKLSILNEATGKTVTTISLFAGEEINLKAQVSYKKLPIESSDKAYTWTVTGDIGSINEEGVFKAADINQGSGKIQASVNGVSATINVNITSEGWQVETFEGTGNFFTDMNPAGVKVKINSDLTKVKYGYKSALLEYDFASAGLESLSIPLKASFSKAPKMIGFYIYGDGSGNDVELAVTTKEGKKTVAAANLNFSGWKLITVDMPSDTSSLDGINILKIGKDKGSIYLDQFMAGIGYYVDTKAPEITLSEEDGTLPATIKDDMDSNISLSNIKLTMDGKSLSFQFNKDAGTLTATLNITDDKMHRLALEVSDQSGNIARKSISIAGKAGTAGTDSAFVDIKGHWAKDNIEYLYGLGIVSGSNTDQGLKYNPGKNITRAEFAVLMTNWIGEKADAYKNTSLPFIDTSTIPAWALDSVKAMYGMGIIAGTGTDKGVVFNPTGSISRQEVMTIIGRTQARGFEEASLAAFTDNKNVSDWAVPYVSSLVGQGVVAGSGGKLNPKNFITRAEAATIITGLN